MKYTFIQNHKPNLLYYSTKKDKTQTNQKLRNLGITVFNY